MEMTARLIADRAGVQSIHAGVAAGNSAPDTTKAFVELVRVTSLIDAAAPELEAWLLANEAADGTMPKTSATQVGRASIGSDEGGPTLYITPLGSSMLLAE